MENENILVDESTENVEQTTEEMQQPTKTYTQEEVDAIIGKKKARWEAKMRKENERTYGGLIETLKAGTGKESVEEINDTFTKFYEGKGIKINKPRNDYSAKEIETLAKADANEIIGCGFDEVVEEADRLNELGADNMTAKEKAVFKILTDHIKSTEQANELAKIGISEDVYNSKEFKDFAGMFKESTPISVIYDNYKKTQPKKEFKTTGSMKTTTSDDNGVKEYYTPEEARKFTKAELDKNPALFDAIVKSMPKWKNHK
jgi:hypothetical protein